ncbi:MAG: RNA-directed DNA polymerase [Ramlibacter sp.]
MAQLVQAWEQCERYKRSTDSAAIFRADIERNLCELAADLLDGTYAPGRSTCFVVTHPRPREVWAASFRDRIVHQLLYNAIAPAFLCSFIANSSACIPGRGTGYAAQRLEHDVRSITQNWARPAFYLKCDLANFFVSIKKPVLQAQLHARVTDPYWRWLTDTVLMHDPRTDYEYRGDRSLIERVPPHKRLVNAPDDTGLPIGNLSSQFFANVHLDALDKHVKCTLRGRYYGRYVDDFYLLHESADWLNAALTDLSTFLPERLGAQLNPRKTILQPVARGVDFVGQVVKPWRRTTRRRSVQAAIKRIQQMPASAVHAAGNSYLGQVRQASHSHQEQAQIARALLKRGHAVAAGLHKIFKSNHPQPPQKSRGTT